MPDAVDVEFSKDLLTGADEIAEFLFGDQKYRRKIYYLAERSKLPVFRLRSQLYPPSKRKSLAQGLDSHENKMRT
jgi:hypothetical protein